MSIQLNAATRLKAASGDAWFDSLTKEKQAEYVKQHPNSKYAKKAGESTLKESRNGGGSRNLGKEAAGPGKNSKEDSLRKEFDSANSKTLTNMASNKNLPEDLQLKLINSGDELHMQTLARNPNLGPKATAELLKSKDPKVLWGLAHTTQDAAVLNKLVQHDDNTKLSVYCNPKCPTKLIQSMDGKFPHLDQVATNVNDPAKLALIAEKEQSNPIQTYRVMKALVNNKALDNKAAASVRKRLEASDHKETKRLLTTLNKRVSASVAVTINAAARIESALGDPLSADTVRMNLALKPTNIRLTDADKKDKGYIIPMTKLPKRMNAYEVMNKAFGNPTVNERCGNKFHRTWPTAAGTLEMTNDASGGDKFMYFNLIK